MRIGFLFAWYDLWVGAYWDRKAHWLYIMIPMCGIILKFGPPSVLSIQQHNDQWYICDPEKVQIGGPSKTCHDAYLRAWAYYKRIKELESDEQT